MNNISNISNINNIMMTNNGSLETGLEFHLQAIIRKPNKTSKYEIPTTKKITNNHDLGTSASSECMTNLKIHGTMVRTTWPCSERRNDRFKEQWSGQVIVGFLLYGLSRFMTQQQRCLRQQQRWMGQQQQYVRQQQRCGKQQQRCMGQQQRYVRQHQYLRKGLHTFSIPSTYSCTSAVTSSANLRVNSWDLGEMASGTVEA